MSVVMKMIRSLKPWILAGPLIFLIAASSWALACQPQTPELPQTSAQPPASPPLCSKQSRSFISEGEGVWWPCFGEQAFTSFQFIVFIQNSRLVGQANRSLIHSQWSPRLVCPHLLPLPSNFEASVEVRTHIRPQRET